MAVLFSQIPLVPEIATPLSSGIRLHIGDVSRKSMPDPKAWLATQNTADDKTSVERIHMQYYFWEGHHSFPAFQVPAVICYYSGGSRLFCYTGGIYANRGRWRHWNVEQRSIRKTIVFLCFVLHGRSGTGIREIRESKREHGGCAFKWYEA